MFCTAIFYLGQLQEALLWDSVTETRQTHLVYLWFISLSPRLFSFISLSLCITLLSPAFPLSYSSLFCSPYKAHSDFQGGVSWPSVVNKDLERQPQSWLVDAEAPGALGKQQRALKAPPDLQVHLSTRQWLSGSCIAPQISAGYTAKQL